jgi:RND superfamily putative drug exporter
VTTSPGVGERRQEGRRPGITSRYARTVVRGRVLIVAVWVAVAVATTALLPNLDEAQTGALGDLVPADSEAVDAELRALELFAFPVLSRTLLVQRDPDGLSPGAQARIVERAAAINQGAAPGLRAIAGAIPVTNALGAPPFARERSTTGITYLLFPPSVGRGEREAVAERLAAAVAREEDHFVGVTGAIPARDAQSEAITAALPRVELATVAIVALAVGLHFRALLAPLVTLVAIAIAYFVPIRSMAGLGERLGISVPAEVEPVVIVLLFGVLTDYAIFFFSRLRRRLGEGEAPLAAAEGATAELQGIILTAGLTVAAGSAALVVADLGFFQAFGPGLALAVLVALAVALTFIPAALAILGRAVLWPGGARPAARTAVGRGEARTGGVPLAGPGRGEAAPASLRWAARLRGRGARRTNRARSPPAGRRSWPA